MEEALNVDGCRCDDVATKGCMRGWSTQTDERKKKTNRVQRKKSLSTERMNK